MSNVRMTITDCDQPDLIGRSWTTDEEGNHRIDRQSQRIYVASSWRCVMQPAVVAALRSAQFEVYDFKNPREGDHGFHWSDVMPSYTKVGIGSPEQLADATEYVEALSHPISEAGFKSDFDAMEWADTCVLVLPCGRSAHLELGWFVGQHKRTAILLDGDLNDGKVTPELMYKMVDYVAPSLFDLLGWLGVDD